MYMNHRNSLLQLELIFHVLDFVALDEYQSLSRYTKIIALDLEDWEEEVLKHWTWKFEKTRFGTTVTVSDSVIGRALNEPGSRR